MKRIFTLILLLFLIPALCFSQDLKAKRVRIDDNGSYYTGTEVETALQEIGAGTTGSGTFLKLDCSNDPLTGVELDAGSANITTTGTITSGSPVEINAPTGNAVSIINAETNANLTYLYLLEGLHSEYTTYKKYGIYLKYNGDSNDFAIGNVQADVETDNFYIDRDTGNVGFGTASSPNKVLHASWVSADTTVTTGNALGGGGVGKGVLIANTSGTTNTYANLDFRTSSADGRIAYQVKGTNNGDFHFITDNGGVFPIVFTIENEGLIHLPLDSQALTFGVAKDASIYYDGTDFIFDSQEVGTGDFLFKNGDITNPQPSGASGIEGERFGRGALDSLTTGNGNTAFGFNALTAVTTGADNVAIGSSAAANVIGAVGNVALGTSALFNCTTGNNNMAIGKTALQNVVSGGNNVAVGESALQTTTGTGNIGIGASTIVTPITSNYSIMIGYSANATASNQCVIGSNNAEITQFYLGNGVTYSNPQDTTLNATGGSGTNIAGADLGIAAGKGTGSGVAGEVLFQTSTVGTSGTTLQTLNTNAKIDSSITAGDTRFMLWDVDNATLERVTVGIADSAGVGFKVLRIPN